MTNKTVAMEEETPESEVWEPIVGFDDIAGPAIPADFLPTWAGTFVREVS